MTGGLLKSASTLAILAAAGLMIGGAAMTPKAAYAADLGGDCCADLEERVAELEATTARKGNKNVALTITGRVNANILYWNDNSGVADSLIDNSKDIYFGNVGGSESRFVFKGEGKLNKDVTAGFNMEVRNDFSVAATSDQVNHQAGPNLLSKATYVYLASKSLGKLQLGFQDAAADNGWYQDLSGGTVGGLSGGRFINKMQLRNAAGALTGKKMSSLLGEPTDGKDNGIMYVSPNIAGIEFRADYRGSDSYSASAVYTGKFNTINVAAGAAYLSMSQADAVNGPSCNICAGGTENLYGVSASIYESGSGLFLSGEYGGANTNVTGVNNWKDYFVHAGWHKNATGLGETAIDGQYDKSDSGKTHDGVTYGAAHFWGVGIDQALDSVASNVYLHYQRDTYEGDQTVAAHAANVINSQDIDTVLAGMIVRF